MWRTCPVPIMRYGRVGPLPRNRQDENMDTRSRSSPAPPYTKEIAMSQPNPDATIGFVGLGAMGAPMAERLSTAGHALAVYNRSSAKADPLVARGAKRAETPGGVCTPGGMVLSIVADDAALE